jgi:hypothetical protein
LKSLLDCELNLSMVSIYEGGVFDDPRVAESLAKGWRYALAGPQRPPVNLDFMIKVHDIVSPWETGFAREPVNYTGYYSEEGLEAMHELVRRLQAKGIPATFEEASIKRPLADAGSALIQMDYRCEAVDDDVWRELIDEYFDEYREDIARPGQDEDAKLLAIATLCYRLVRTHPFRNANQRTTFRILLNRLLIDNDMRPAFIGSTGASPRELVERIKKSWPSSARDMTSGR